MNFKPGSIGNGRALKQLGGAAFLLLIGFAGGTYAGLFKTFPVPQIITAKQTLDRLRGGAGRFTSIKMLSSRRARMIGFRARPTS